MTPDLNIKQQFATMLRDANKYPVMTSMDDNLQYQFIHPTNDYPMNPDNFGFDALRYNTSATYISLLTQIKDPRVFVTANRLQHWLQEVRVLQVLTLF